MKNAGVEATPTTLTAATTTELTPTTSDEGTPTISPQEKVTVSFIEEVVTSSKITDEEDISSTPDLESTTSSSNEEFSSFPVQELTSSKPALATKGATFLPDKMATSSLIIKVKSQDDQ